MNERPLRQQSKLSETQEKNKVSKKQWNEHNLRWISLNYLPKWAIQILCSHWCPYTKQWKVNQSINDQFFSHTLEDF